MKGSILRAVGLAVFAALVCVVCDNSVGESPNPKGAADEFMGQVTGRPTHTISTGATPYGGGTVSRSPNREVYASGVNVTVTASASSGYRFTGWSDNGSTANPRTVTINSNLSLTASFKRLYTLTTSASPYSGGSISRNPGAADGFYVDGDQVTVTATSNTGYRFTKWSDGSTTNPRTVTINGNLSLTASFIRVYTVTFNANGAAGTTPPAMTADSGSSITLPGSDMSKTGHSFGGWNTSSSGTGSNYTAGSYFPVNGNITLYAQWDRVYTVTYSTNGGNGATPGPETVYAGRSVTLPSGGGLSRSCHTFGGWNTSSSGTGANYSAGLSYTPDGEVTLYAKWNIITYTVTFDYNGGSGTIAANPMTVNCGSGITLPGNATRAGYTFGGWNTSSSGTGFNYTAGSSYTPDGSITLYAVWTRVYTVTFSANGGSGTTPVALTAAAGNSVTLPYGSGLSRSCHTFGGWNTGSSGTGTNYSANSPYTPASDVTLYARWDIITYTVTFDNNGGDGTIAANPMTVSCGSGITLPAGTGLSRTGYTFGGWNTNINGTGINYPAGESYPPAGNVTLYAKWNADPVNPGGESAP
jgi:uncharacterized repeat protein (TIGR02543 family)